MTDDDGDEMQIEVIPEELEYKFLPDGESQLRAFVFECMSSPEYALAVLLPSMATAVEWIKTGKLPDKRNVYAIHQK